MNMFSRRNASSHSRFEDIWLDPETYTLYPTNTAGAHCRPTQPGRRPGRRRKNWVTCPPVEDIWISALDNDDCLDVPEATRTDSPLLGQEDTVFNVKQYIKVADSLLVDLVAEHEKWMLETFNSAPYVE